MSKSCVPEVSAVIGQPGRYAARNWSGEKEMVGAYSLIVLHAGQLHEAVIFRSYMGRSRSASTVYGSIWAYGNSAASREGVGGSGKAGGYGYHKESAALEAALHHARIAIQTTGPDGAINPVHIGGRGTSEYETVFTAIAAAMGWDTSTVFLVQH